MQRARANLPISVASLLALVLVALTAVGAAHTPQSDALAQRSSAELSSSQFGRKAALSDSAQQAPFIRSASRTQAGLRSKTPEPSGKSLLAIASLRSADFPLQHAARAHSGPCEPSSFIALRAIGPRAPPLQHS